MAGEAKTRDPQPSGNDYGESIVGWRHILRGCCMGAADVVPGVSGGTVALVLGIYPRLITAISRFDRPLLLLLRQRQWQRAIQHVDLWFLTSLLIGILVGLALTLVTVARLLYQPESRPFVLAAFFGLILGSMWLVARMIRPWTLTAVIWVVPGIAVALFLGLMTPAEIAIDPPMYFVFVCGAIAISAMILPGISGAAILVLLGLYGFLVHAPVEIVQGNEVARNGTALLVFAAGCAAGLALFSRLLKWWLARFPRPTMAFLAGLMAGSLLRLWPIQRDLTPETEEFKRKVFQPMWAAPWDYQWWPLWLLAAACAATVVALDWMARRAAKLSAESRGQ